MSFLKKIVIGTTKLGMPYGTAQIYQVRKQEVSDIFYQCDKAGLTCFDTAPSYGTAETLIGKYHKQTLKTQLVTKLAKLTSPIIDQESINFLQNTFENSLEKMCIDSCYGLLIHDVSDLYKPNSENLIQWLYDLKNTGRVKKVGVSVYSPSEVDKLKERFKFDLIQLPCNIFDQRFIESGMLFKLKKMGVEIHARSLFLKGIILKPNINVGIPNELVEQNIKFYRYLAEKKLLPYDACFQFANSQKNIDKWVIGVSKKSHITQLVGQVEQVLSSNREKLDFELWSMKKSQNLDPRYW